MRRALLLLTIAISLSGGILLRAADDFIVSRFSDYLDAIRSQAGIPGLAVALVRTGETTWERAYGRVDLERGTPATPITPFELDGTTQTLTAAMVLRCVEEGRLSLDDRLSKYSTITPGSAADVTIRQALSHTTQTSEGLVFTYRLDRLDAIAAALATCWETPFRQAVATQLDRLGMLDSVPGADVVTATQVTATTTQAEMATLQQYSSVLQNLAKPYAVDTKGRTTPSAYSATTLTPSSGLISTVHDLTRFDSVLRKGTLIKPETLAEAWTPPVDHDGFRLPHGLGWFVQQYNGERVVWQFGVSDNASSSMILMVPGRGLTLILVANSQGLVRPFALSAGDVMVSPFARLFLSVFVR
jgi:CubicO group peptidase (beta-lactamase class C family)